MALLDPEALDTLNALLEDTRASVEIEIALANGATERRERETLTAMGGEEVLACCALRERLTLAGAPVTWRISGIAYQILNAERYDERLRAFAHHQAAICERAQAVLAAVTDQSTHRLLQDLYDSHVRSALWAEERANQFAATRLLDFTVPARASASTAHVLSDEAPLEPSAPPPLPAASAASGGGTRPAEPAGLDPDATVSGEPEREILLAHDHEPDHHNGHTPLTDDPPRDDDSPRDDSPRDDRAAERDGAPHQE